MRENRYHDIDTNFQDFAENRGVGVFKQNYEIFVRNWYFLMRNKRALGGVVFNSVFFSLMILALFWNIGVFPDLIGIAIKDGEKKAQSDFQTYIMNIRGLAFMLSNQLGISASMNAILQVPLQAPVMERELANKMYSPSAYYNGRFYSNLIL